MNQKFRVITVHGVNTKGAWQEEVAEALKAFFDFEPIKYNHYRWFCGSELVLNPFIWVPLGIAVAILIKQGEVRGPMAISVSIFAILLLALLGTYPYRWWATKVVRERLSKKFHSVGPPPFLIAHSFGTYLTGTSLQKLAWPHFERIVVAGCVLKKHFPWDKLHRERPPRLREVRNEMAARDNVARLATWLDRLIPGFGSAGYSGFVGSADAVHNVESANTVCAVCEAKLDRAPVHNVKCRELGHSDVFLGPAYAVMYWLPFLWGYDPAAYQDFLYLCFLIDRTPQRLQKRALYQKLRASSWGQTPKKSLDEEIRDVIPNDRNPLSPEELDKIAAETLRLVLLGQQAFDEESFTDRDKYVQFLNIYFAIDTAWKRAANP